MKRHEFFVALAGVLSGLDLKVQNFKDLLIVVEGRLQKAELPTNRSMQAVVVFLLRCDRERLVSRLLEQSALERGWDLYEGSILLRTFSRPTA